MARPREKKPKPPETPLQALFLKRVRAVMDGMTISELARRAGAPPQTTLNDVLNAGAVPGLTVVHQISTALGVHAWELMIEPERLAADPETNVKRLPDLYPKVFSSLRHIRSLKQKKGA